MPEAKNKSQGSARKMKKLEFSGFDANLKTAMFEHGLIVSEQKNKVIIIQGDSLDDNLEYNSFKIHVIDKKDIDEMFKDSSIPYNNVAKYAGMGLEKWQKSSLHTKLQTIKEYWNLDDILKNPLYIINYKKI